MGNNMFGGIDVKQLVELRTINLQAECAETKLETEKIGLETAQVMLQDAVNKIQANNNKECKKSFASDLDGFRLEKKAIKDYIKAEIEDLDPEDENYALDKADLIGIEGDMIEAAKDRWLRNSGWSSIIA